MHPITASRSAAGGIVAWSVVKPSIEVQCQRIHHRGIPYSRGRSYCAEYVLVLQQCLAASSSDQRKPLRYVLTADPGGGRWFSRMRRHTIFVSLRGDVQ